MKVKRIANSESNPLGDRYKFVCPGCGDIHVIPTSVPQPNGAVWSFNGNVDAPTFSPSLLVSSGHCVEGFYTAKEDCIWCNDPSQEMQGMCYVCHSYIVDGKIQFLSDCTHKLAGQTVEMNEITD